MSPDLESRILTHLIERAEKTLADHRASGTSTGGGGLILFEAMIVQMYEERCLVIEEMMRLPFRSETVNGPS